MFKTLHLSFIQPEHDLCLLTEKIDKDALESTVNT